MLHIVEGGDGTRSTGQAGKRRHVVNSLAPQVNLAGLGPESSQVVYSCARWHRIALLTQLLWLGPADPAHSLDQPRGVGLEKDLAQYAPAAGKTVAERVASVGPSSVSAAACQIE